MNAKDYLARIGYRGGTEPTAANLAALVQAHRLTVPYETLDLWRGRHVALSMEALYDKIVTRRRGGYCFELNGLFAWLLRELGYNVREYFGRWLMNEEMSVPQRRHRVICVAIPGEPNLLPDVGVGIPLLTGPIKLVFDTPQQVGRSLYRVRRDPVLTCLVEVRRNDGTWEKVFSFDTAPQLPLDFSYAHWWCETHPDSSFRRKAWVFLLRADGSSRSISLDFDPETGERVPTLAETPPAGAQRLTPLRSEAAFAAALKDVFGIVEG